MALDWVVYFCRFVRISTYANGIFSLSLSLSLSLSFFLAEWNSPCSLRRFKLPENAPPPFIPLHPPFSGIAGAHRLPILSWIPKLLSPAWPTFCLCVHFLKLNYFAVSPFRQISLVLFHQFFSNAFRCSIPAKDTYSFTQPHRQCWASSPHACSFRSVHNLSVAVFSNFRSNFSSFRFFLLPYTNSPLSIEKQFLNRSALVVVILAMWRRHVKKLAKLFIRACKRWRQNIHMLHVHIVTHGFWSQNQFVCLSMWPEPKGVTRHLQAQ